MKKWIIIIAAAVLLAVLLGACGNHTENIIEKDTSAVGTEVIDADTLGVDQERIGVGGDSAGPTLAVGVCMGLITPSSEVEKFCLFV